MDQFHSCVIQCIEKFQEDPSLFAHLPNDEAEGDTEHDKPQHVDSVRICPNDFIVLGDILQREETRRGFIQLAETRPGSGSHSHVSSLQRPIDTLCKCFPSPLTRGYLWLIIGSCDAFRADAGCQVQKHET